MKIIKNIFIGAFLCIGVFYASVLIVLYFFPEGVSFSNRSCNEIVLSMQMSPNIERSAKHLKLECEDGLVQHSLIITMPESNKDRSSEGSVFYSNQNVLISEIKGDIYPLRLWWETNESLAVQHQDGIKYIGGNIAGVHINASSYPLTSQFNSHPTAIESARESAASN